MVRSSTRRAPAKAMNTKRQDDHSPALRSFHNNNFLILPCTIVGQDIERRDWMVCGGTFLKCHVE